MATTWLLYAGICAGGLVTLRYRWSRLVWIYVPVLCALVALLLFAPSSWHLREAQENIHHELLVVLLIMWLTAFIAWSGQWWEHYWVRRYREALTLLKGLQPLFHANIIELQTLYSSLWERTGRRAKACAIFRELIEGIAEHQDFLRILPALMWHTTTKDASELHAYMAALRDVERECPQGEDEHMFLLLKIPAALYCLERIEQRSAAVLKKA